MKRQPERKSIMNRFASVTLKTLSLVTILSATLSAADAADTRRSTLRAQPGAPTAGGIIAQGPAKPDLIILPRYAGNNGQPQSGYCGPWNGGNQSVQFYVKNIGGAASAHSVVQVNFGGKNVGTLQVPALAPNQQTLRSKSIPLAAWGPSQYHASVQFLIAADHNDDMVEASEANNYGQSTCVGPAS
jgi:hypothetical protein